MINVRWDTVIRSVEELCKKYDTPSPYYGELYVQALHKIIALTHKIECPAPYQGRVIYGEVTIETH